MYKKWATAWQNQQNELCAQRRLTSAWASAQSDQSLRCPHEETLGPELPIEHKVKTELSLCWRHVILLVLSCGGSNVNGCSVWIQNCVMRVAVLHHMACRVVPNSHPITSWDGIFNWHSMKSLYFGFKWRCPTPYWSFQTGYHLMPKQSITELLHDKTNKMTCAPSKDSDQPVHLPGPEFLLSAWRNIESLTTYWVHSEDSDQAGWMHVILLVLSCGGSNVNGCSVWIENCVMRVAVLNRMACHVCTKQLSHDVTEFSTGIQVAIFGFKWGCPSPYW